MAAVSASSIPEPTVAELSSFVNGGLELVVETIGFAGDYSDPDTVPGSLFVLLAGSANDIPDMTISDVAGISYCELESVLREWCPPSASGPSMAAPILLKSRARRLLKACKLALKRRQARLEPPVSQGKYSAPQKAFCSLLLLPLPPPPHAAAAAAAIATSKVFCSLGRSQRTRTPPLLFNNKSLCRRIKYTAGRWLL